MTYIPEKNIAKKYRIHGKPLKIVTLHGGPGEFGGVVNLAVTLSEKYGVLEPFLTEDTIMGQVHGLKNIIDQHVSDKLILIGHSWGAWIAYIFTATYPLMVKKLVLVGSGPYEHHYYTSLKKKRNQRFSKEDKQQIVELNKMLTAPDIKTPKIKNKSEILWQIGAIFSKVDNIDLLETPVTGVEKIDSQILNIQPDYFHNLLHEAMEMRKSGRLLRFADAITCPVIAIHGSYDPHPYLGVENPLKKHLKEFTFYLIEHCGHKPWLERYAHQDFYRILNHEIKKTKTHAMVKEKARCSGDIKNGF
ncbi:MAG: alpha/beta hydrolase [Desulfobacteraceae bacterium]|jgi:pimeloyl-ACP methyl ester carboxylesterase